MNPMAAIQDGSHGRHLENLYLTSSLEAKGQLIKNLSGNQVSDTVPCWPSCLILAGKLEKYWKVLFAVSKS